MSEPPESQSLDKSSKKELPPSKAQVQCSHCQASLRRDKLKGNCRKFHPGKSITTMGNKNSSIGAFFIRKRPADEAEQSHESNPKKIKESDTLHEPAPLDSIITDSETDQDPTPFNTTSVSSIEKVQEQHMSAPVHLVENVIDEKLDNIIVSGHQFNVERIDYYSC